MTNHNDATQQTPLEEDYLHQHDTRGVSGPVFASVVIPAYNEEKYLRACLECINQQVCDWNFEVIVVDNGSTDRTNQIAVEMGARVVVEPRKGIASACQTGFDAAQGTIIAVTDADTLVPPNWLQDICAALVANPQCVAATGPYEFYGSAVMHAVGRLWFSVGYPATRLAGATLGRGFFPLVGPNYAVRADSLRAVGGLDRSLMTCVDSALSDSLTAHGKIMFLPHTVVRTSARRFNGSFTSAFVTLFGNYFSMVFARRALFARLPDFR